MFPVDKLKVRERRNAKSVESTEVLFFTVEEK